MYIKSINLYYWQVTIGVWNPYQHLAPNVHDMMTTAVTIKDNKMNRTRLLVEQLHNKNRISSFQFLWESIPTQAYIKLLIFSPNITLVIPIIKERGKSITWLLQELLTWSKDDIFVFVCAKKHTYNKQTRNLFSLIYVVLSWVLGLISIIYYFLTFNLILTFTNSKTIINTGRIHCIFRII